MFVPGHHRLQEGNGAFLFLAFQDLCIGDAGMIIDADMDELPADPAGTALALAVPCDAMAGAVELAQLLDIHMDQLTRLIPLIADHRLGRCQIPPAVEAMAHQYAADGGAGETGLVCNEVIDAPLPAQCNDHGLDGFRRLGRAIAGSR